MTKTVQTYFVSKSPAWWAYWRQYLQAIIIALIVALLIRHFLLEAYRVRGDSMFPTLLAGDTVFINKLSYFTKVPFSHKIISKVKNPKRGDVVVFELEGQKKRRFIKRVIGLPGDEIVMQAGVLSVNGKRITGRNLGELRYQADNKTAEVQGVVRESELGGKKYRVFQNGKIAQQKKEIKLYVPGEAVYVMGDNQSTFNDPRELNFVPVNSLLGRAIFVSLSYDQSKRNIRWQRLGKGIE